MRLNLFIARIRFHVGIGAGTSTTITFFLLNEFACWIGGQKMNYQNQIGRIFAQRSDAQLPVIRQRSSNGTIQNPAPVGGDRLQFSQRSRSESSKRNQFLSVVETRVTVGRVGLDPKNQKCFLCLLYSFQKGKRNANSIQRVNC